MMIDLTISVAGKIEFEAFGGVFYWCCAFMKALNLKIQCNFFNRVWVKHEKKIITRFLSLLRGCFEIFLQELKKTPFVDVPLITSKKVHCINFQRFPIKPQKHILED